MRERDGEPMPLGHDRGRGVLEGAFQILDALARAPLGAGLSALARNTGLPKATVHRLLEQLVDLGAVQRHDRGYCVGRLLARIGDSWQPHPGLVKASRGPLSLLSSLTSTATCVTVLRGGRVRVITGTRGPVTEIPMIRPGDEYPLETAAGRVLTLTNPATSDERPPTLTVPQWRRERAAFHRSGSIIVDHQEVVAGLCCVATPIRAKDGTCIATVSTLMINKRIPAGLPDLVRRAATEISDNLHLGEAELLSQR